MAKREQDRMAVAPVISLIHYWFFDLRGGEQVVANIAKALPFSKAYALFGKTAATHELLPKTDVQFSPFNSLPALDRYYRNLLPLYPLCASSLQVQACDIVISNESGPAKAVRIPKRALHICNCLTPMRYLWSNSGEYLDSLKGYKRVIFRASLPFLRQWDLRSSRTVHHYISISNNVAERVKKFYGRESTVIYPPVRYDKFHISSQNKDYYFVLSALVSYKRIDLAVRAFNELRLPLRIAGSGPEYNQLKRLAGPNIEFLGRVDDEDLPRLYSNAKAFIFPGEEDYGITPLEAQASGTPVIAFRKGGATETVTEGKTGWFFDHQTPESLIDAVRKFESKQLEFGPQRIREEVAKFREEDYQCQIREFVLSKWEAFQAARPQK